ncbi:esterase/lipase family protein [Mycolicibacterium gilvum]|uniref:esterase/lipase family protein n=1 Tax=Mycolicibacterium gilvum TaxID=1804 RepID=UPI0040460DF9
MADNDLIIVIPGITGSTLRRNGADVWSSKPTTVLATIATLGKHIAELQLPADIGDEAPEDGTEATQLISTLHCIPGLWTPIHGYEKLVKRLRASIAIQQFGDLNPVLFPYDWRLSNRYTARRLKVYAEQALSRWRDCAPQNRDAKITFVCHSMGGLIARWYISKEGGAPITRKMITLGTPYRGAIKALSVLADGPMPILGRFGEHLHRAAVSFPSVHQLLPSYACVNHGDGELEYLADQTDSVLTGSLRRDAALFYQQLEEAESADPENPTRRHAIVGARQPTTASASLINGRYVFSELLGHHDLAGDGTVSAASGPKGIPLDDNSIRRIADKHGHLQSNDAALDEVESVVRSVPVIVKAGPTESLSVAMPEIFAAEEPVTATISSPTGPRSVAITVRGEHGGVIEHVEKVIREGAFQYQTAALDPGGYSLEVRSVTDGASTSGVNSAFLVWHQ